MARVFQLSVGWLSSQNRVSILHLVPFAAGLAADHLD
jgi:hypothetical protein